VLYQLYWLLVLLLLIFLAVLYLDLGGMTLTPGVYKFASSGFNSGHLILDAQGDPDAVWVFQAGSTIIFNGGSTMSFKDDIGSCSYVYWQVGSSATFEISSQAIGNVH
jgi:hypothetical protein